MSQRETPGTELTGLPARNARLTLVAAAGFAVGGLAWLLAAWVGEWNTTYLVFGCASVAMSGVFVTRAAGAGGGGGG